MPLLAAFLLMAQVPEAVHADVTLRHRRPSVVVAQAKGLGGAMVPDDGRSLVAVSGTPAEVESAKEFLRLVDVPRKTLLVRVTVASPADHFAWTVDARLTNGQVWRTADDETGMEVTLQPRLAADGALNVALLARCRGNGMTSSMRIRKGKDQKIVLGRQIVQEVHVDADAPTSVSPSTVPLPTVTVRYVGN